MALTNAQKQKRWRRRNQVVLTEDAEAIALKLIAMDRAKLRKVHNRITNYLKDTTGMKKAQREYYANWGVGLQKDERSEEKQWVAEGGSLADYKAGLRDMKSKVYDWRRQKYEESEAAEDAAWLRDHPGEPRPKFSDHPGPPTKAEKRYDRWKMKYDLENPYSR
jgi:hypothetical protein